MPDNKRLWGTLFSSEKREPLAEAVIQVLTADGETLATARANAAGRYDMQLPASAFDGPLHTVITDPEQRILLSTRESPVRLRGTECQLDVLVPGAFARGAREQRFVRDHGSIDVDALADSELEPEDVLEIARTLVGTATRAPAAAARAAVRESLAPSVVERSLCGTPMLEALEHVIRTKGWPREVSLQLDDILAMRDSGFAAATYETEHFVVSYQTDGPAAVAASTTQEVVLDPGTTKQLATIGDGVTPTYILRVCFWLERALSAYVSRPFSMKNPAAAAKIPVVINSAPYGSASSSGTFYLNNALAPDLICAVSVHELFHMVQFQYGGAGLWRQSVVEGGAVFAEDTAADKLNRYLDEAGSNFNGIGTQANTNLSLARASYKCCLFWRYVAEQHSADRYEPFVGVETYRSVIEHCAAGSYSTTDVRSALRKLPWHQDFFEFAYLDEARADLANAETTLGNYALACYLKDLGKNCPDTRFDFLEDEEDIYIDQVVGGPPSTTLASVTLAGTGLLTTAGTVAFTGDVSSFAQRYYEVSVDAAVTNLQVDFAATAGLTSCLFQIALIDQDGRVRDILRTDRTQYSKRVVNTSGGKRLSKIALIVTGADTGGTFNLSVNPAAPSSDVMITRWNTRAGQEHEIDSRNWAWTWVSPDIWVEGRVPHEADCEVLPDRDNKLSVRLHNKGNALAANIQIELYYQTASGGLSDDAWEPVRDKSGAVQVLRKLSLSAGASQVFTAKWCPKPPIVTGHFCVRAVVTVPGDPNVDNKRAISNFGKVRLKPNEWKDIPLLVRRVYPDAKPGSLQVVPRLGANPEIKLSSRDVRDIRSAHEQRRTIRIAHVPRAPSAAVAQASPARRTLVRAPDPSAHHPVDALALPPAVASKPMITIIELQDGVARGGVTLLVELEH